MAHSMSILTAPRFSFDSPTAQSESRWHVRPAWISDVHLGTRTSNAPALLEFLRDYECERLYIVGDLIDVWQLRRGATGRSSITMSSRKSCAKRARARRSFTSLAITTNS